MRWLRWLFAIGDSPGWLGDDRHIRIIGDCFEQGKVLPTIYQRFCKDCLNEELKIVYDDGETVRWACVACKSQNIGVDKTRPLPSPI